ncbi:MAG: bifunctional riboflavin kinase/FAD synthetase [Corynebacterium sp.]|nr:bifunctional riboflavin kinase/FAD synthetase [Corynebacterium sp.]
MRIWHGLDTVPEGFGPCVVTIGVFDGVHRGHQSLLQATVNRARELGVKAVMITFDPHPIQVIRPQNMLPLLSTVQERAAVAAEIGIDDIVVLVFDRAFSGIMPEQYFTDILMGTLGARAVLVGENFTFGHMATGTTQMLEEYGRTYGVDVEIVPLFDDVDPHGETERVCSTLIRTALAAGDVREAAWALGRTYAVTSVVMRGAGRGGRELGYPTANMYVNENVALPGDGVYAGWFTVHSDPPVTQPMTGSMQTDRRYMAAVSVGTNPTFGDARRSIESYVLDEDADLYGRVATVEFVERVRGMEKFDSVEELLAAMARDVATVREILQPGS